MNKEAMKLALEALELAQDNLRDHGDNCFLHDEGEFNRCFCGKDSLSNHLQSVVEKLEEALAEQPAQQEPVAWMQDSIELYVQDRPSAYYTIPLYTSPPAQRTWVGLTESEKSAALYDKDGMTLDYEDYAEAIEAKLRSKNEDRN